MKKIYSLLFVVTTTLLSLSACKKETGELGIFTCKVNGVDWSATKETIALHAGIPLNLIGRNDSTTIIINFQDVNDIGTYLINDSSVHFAQYIDGPETFDIYKSYYYSSGAVTITEISDKKVKGTFDTLKLSNSFVFKYLTNGNFEIDIK